MQIKRAFDAVEETDGFRILVDRLWPRGISKEDLKLDQWMKEIAPSNELRRWFGHEPEKFEEFSQRYKDELDSKSDQIHEIIQLCRSQEIITLIYAAKDDQHNNAVVLKEFLGE